LVELYEVLYKKQAGEQFGLGMISDGRTPTAEVRYRYLGKKDYRDNDDR
jgi:hypothetical protein